MKREKGLTLIELLIVLAIVGILVAVAVPGYLGMQERSRKAAITRAAAAAEADLQAWLDSSNQLGALAALIECDTNWDGTIDSSDLPNSAIAGNVASAYVSARNVSGDELSPWFPGNPLWSLGGSLNAVSSAQIAVSQSGNQISIIAADMNGNIVHQKVITAD